MTIEVVVLFDHLNLSKFLYEEAIKLSNDEFHHTIVVDIDTWNYNNFVCKNYILNWQHTIWHV